VLDSIEALKDELDGMLNASAFSWDSVEGWVLILIILILAHSIWNKATKAIWWCFGLIVFIQVCYTLGGTGFNDYIPFDKMFKYDVMTALAQCFKGTFVCDFLLWFDSFLIVVLQKLWNMGSGVFKALWNICVQIFEDAKSIGDSGAASK
jgi:hypothetical protein